MRPSTTRAGDGGYILGIVLVFLVVLSISAALGSRLMRTDLLAVNDLRNEKRALEYGEAGTGEAMLRLRMADPTNFTVNGSTFNAAIHPDSTNPAWAAQIYFGLSAVSAGPPVTAPTIQANAIALPYTTTLGGADPPLTVDFLRCTAVGTGCASVGAIRLIGGQPVVRIRSTGQSGTSRQTITVLGTYASGSGATFVVLANAQKAVDCSGACDLNVTPSTLQVNSTFSNAVNVSGGGKITGTVDIVGGCAGTCNVSPVPNLGSPPVADPLAYLQAMEPARPGSLPLRTDALAALLPGYYPAGITVSSTAKTMAPGLYVLGPGTALTVSGGGSLTQTAPGVTIFADQFTISGGSTVTLTAPSSGAYTGIVLWQSAASTQKMVFSGGSSGGIDGALYVPNATLELSGGSGAMKLQFVVNKLVVSGPSHMSQVSSPVLGGNPKYNVIAWSDFW